MTTVIIETDVTVTTVTVGDPLPENLDHDLDQNLLMSIKIDIVHERDLIRDMALGTTVPEADLVHQILEINIEVMIATAIKVTTSIGYLLSHIDRYGNQGRYGDIILLRF